MGGFDTAADAVRTLAGKDPSPFTSAIIVAAGNSTRMGSKGSKTLLKLCGVPVLARTLLAFEKTPNIAEILVVARAEDVEAVYELAEAYQIRKLKLVTHGGTTRAKSVAAGFAKINPKAKFVAIHDGARCLISPADITKILRAAYRHRAASAASPVTDTVKLATKRGFIERTVDRNKVFLVQTPQVFHADLYRAALATLDNVDALTDDNQLMEQLGHPVRLVDIGQDNIKLTHPQDIARAEFIISKREGSQ